MIIGVVNLCSLFEAAYAAMCEVYEIKVIAPLPLEWAQADEQRGKVIAVATALSLGKGDSLEGCARVLGWRVGDLDLMCKKHLDKDKWVRIARGETKLESVGFSQEEIDNLFRKAGEHWAFYDSMIYDHLYLISGVAKKIVSIKDGELKIAASEGAPVEDVIALIDALSFRHLGFPVLNATGLVVPLG